jgi:polyisoprenoid-binding protein YceI
MIETPTRPTETRRKWVVPVAIVAGLVLLAVAGGLWWFFGGEAPAEVDLEATASAVTTGTAASVTSGAIEGTWSVDTSAGDFTLDETTTATFVGFRVEEVLNSIGSTTAVGRTPEVTGSMTIEGTTLTSAEIVADLTFIVSDESRRDDSIQRALNSSTNPEATFVLTEPIELGDGAAAGELVTVAADGDLTINGVTEPVEVMLEAQLIDGAILVTGTTEVAFADYDITAPTSPAVLSVEDHGVVEVQLWLSPQTTGE